jgi:hypothetical protein
LPRPNEMLRLIGVQLRKAENRSPVDGTRCARHRCVVSRLVDVAAIRFVSDASGGPQKLPVGNPIRLQRNLKNYFMHCL